MNDALSTDPCARQGERAGGGPSRRAEARGRRGAAAASLLALVRAQGAGDAPASGRQRLLERLQEVLAWHVRQGVFGALLVLDVDSFASLRSQLGCSASEAVLAALVQRLAALSPDGELIERLDGDQFAILSPQLAPAPEAAAQGAATLARRLLDGLAAPLAAAGHAIRVQANIGVTVFGAHGASSESLLGDALYALRAAKLGGPDAIHVLEERQRAWHRRHLALRDDLRAALAGRQLLVHYQVQVNADGTPAGVEALARWHHPRDGWVSPDLFIAVAETAGLICELGQRVLEQACADLARWQDGPLATLSVAVNVSPLQLRQPGFAEGVLATLRAAGVAPQRLKLEVTETVLIEEMTRAGTALSALRAAGVRVALDDFGKGYSALAYLKRLPFDQIKIDQAFVRDIADSPVDQEIARAIIALAHALQLDTIAEGIETPAQFLALRALGCRAFQGFLFGRPQPVAALEAAFGAPMPLPGGRSLASSAPRPPACAPARTR